MMYVWKVQTNEKFESRKKKWLRLKVLVGNPKELALYEPLRKLQTALDVFENRNDVTNIELVNAITDAYGKTPSDLLT
jgi:hypothetical protein